MRGIVWVMLSTLALLLAGSNYAYAEEAHGSHDPGHGNAGALQDDPSEWKADLAIYTFVVFIILLLILGTLAWPKIGAALTEREKRIEGNIASAEAMNEEAKRLLAQYEAKLASAAGEVKAMLEEARKHAEGTKDQIIAEARAGAQAERDRAVHDIEIASEQAMKEIAETSANLAVELASKVIRESINPAKQQELVRSALEKLHASAPSRN